MIGAKRNDGVTRLDTCEVDDVFTDTSETYNLSVWTKTRLIDSCTEYVKISRISQQHAQAAQSVGNLKIKEILYLSCALCVFIHRM